MKNKQFLADILLLLAVFIGGYTINNLFNSKFVNTFSLQKCDPNDICFPLDGEKIRVSPLSYIDLLDNKIDETGNSEWRIKRRLGTRPVHQSKLDRRVYLQNNDNWYQVYIDVYEDKGNKAVKTFVPDIYRQF